MHHGCSKELPGVSGYVRWPYLNTTVHSTLTLIAEARDKPRAHSYPASKSTPTETTTPTSKDDNSAQAAAEKRTDQAPSAVDGTIEVAFQLGSFRVRDDGTFEISQGRLLSNIAGLPLQLGMITTITNLIGAQIQYFSQTYIRLGLDPMYIRAWGLFLRPVNQLGKYFGPFTTDQQWSNAIQNLSQTVVADCAHHKISKCPSCQGTPMVIGFFEENHLNNALSTRGLSPLTQLDFVDHDGAPLNELIIACPALRQSIAHMQAAARSSSIRTLPTPYNLPAYIGETYVGSLILPTPRLLGLVNGATLTMSAAINALRQGNTPAGTHAFSARLGLKHGRHALLVSQAQTTTLPLVGGRGRASAPLLRPHSVTAPDAARLSRPLTAVPGSYSNWDTHPPPLKRQRSGTSTPSEGTTKHRRLIVPGKEGAVKEIPARKWEEASERPDTWPDSKDEDDICLTCIQNSRACTGTQLHGATGKCDRCEIGEGNGKGQRRCYWKQSAKRILTYSDAKDADPKGRRLPANTRAGRALRAKKQAEEQGQVGQTGVGSRVISSGDYASDTITQKTQFAEREPEVESPVSEGVEEFEMVKLREDEDEDMDEGGTADSRDRSESAEAENETADTDIILVDAEDDTASASSSSDEDDNDPEEKEQSG